MSQFIEMFGDTHVKSDNSRQWKEVVEIINGKDYKTIQVEDGGYPVYGTGGEMARAADYLSPANSILLGRKGTIDKPLLIKEKYWNVDTAFGAVPDENILNYVYFYWHCKTIDFNILNKGTTLPSTTKVDLLNLWVKIPAMEEQNRFASIVEQADKSGFVGFKSQFIEMFGDFHNKVQIKDVCLVVSGKSIPTKLEDIDGNNPYIKVADFNIPGNEKYITIAQRYVSDDSVSYSKQIPEGSVIFAKNGAASMSNKKRLTKIRCCIDMNTMAVFPKNESILSDFLFATIEAMDVSSHVRQGAIPSISPKSIEDSYVAMPTMEEQYRYVSIAKQADKSGFRTQQIH